MRYTLVLVLLLIQACTNLPKSGVQPESNSYKRHMAQQPKPKESDECYYYLKHPNNADLRCMEYVKKFKGKSAELTD